MFDIDELAAQVAEKVADKLDDELPDGVLQAIAGQAIAVVGDILTKAGNDLATTQNTDGDE